MTRTTPGLQGFRKGATRHDLHRAPSVLIVSVGVGTSPQDIGLSFVFDEVSRLAEAGIEMHVLRPKYELEHLSHGIHFHGLRRRIELQAVVRTFRNLPTYPRTALFRNPVSMYWEGHYAHAAARVLRDYEIDIIHAHFCVPEGLVGLLAKKEIEKPLVVTLHGYDILVEESVGYGARLDKRADAIVRKVLSKADAVVTASHATYREAHKLGNLDARLHLIPEGVDTKRFRPDLDGDRIRERWGIEGKTVVFSLRKHEPKYGLEYVVRAAPSVVAEDNDVVFVMGGDGPLRPYLERLAETLGVRKRVIFTSWVPQEELPYYYAMSDLVVVPSVQEAFGLVVSEAMASGKPVIGTSVGGIPDQIVDGQDGLLVRPRDVGQLAASILELARDPQRRRLLGSNCRKEVESKFSIDRRVADMIKLYRSLV